MTDDNGTLDPPPGTTIKTMSLDDILGKKLPSADTTLEHMLELSVDTSLEPRDRISAARVALSKLIPDKKAMDITHTHTVQELTDAELDRRIAQILAGGRQAGATVFAGGAHAPGKPETAH